jgi:hypothetical protein
VLQSDSAIAAHLLVDASDGDLRACNQSLVAFSPGRLRSLLVTVTDHELRSALPQSINYTTGKEQALTATVSKPVISASSSSTSSDWHSS